MGNWKYLESKAAKLQQRMKKAEIPATDDERQTPILQETLQEIVVSTVPFLYKIAGSMLNGSFKMNTPHGAVYMSAIGSDATVDELVNEAAARLMVALPNYDSAKGGLSTFIAYNAASAMAKYSSQGRGLISLPAHIAFKARKAVRKSRGRNDAIKRIMKSLKVRDLRAATIYYAITGGYKELFAQTDSDPHSLSRDTFEGRYVEDKKAVPPDEAVIKAELEMQIARILQTLTLREAKALEIRFGIGRAWDATLEETAKELYVTRERVRQIEAKALNKIRRIRRRAV